MASPIYTYMVHDLSTNVPLGELPLSGVRFSKKLNDSGQASGSFAVQLAASATIDPYDLTTPCRRALYIYRDERLLWGGIMWSRRYDSGSRSVSIQCSDWWSYFDHRKLLPAFTDGGTAAAGYVAPLSLVYTATDQNQIAKSIVDTVQSSAIGTFATIGVVPDNNTSGTVRDRTYRGYELLSAGEALRNLSAIIGGPDILFDSGGTDVNGNPGRVMRIGTPALGQQGAPWVWELGANMVHYTWPSDGTRYVSRQFATGSGSQESLMVAMRHDQSRYALGHILMDGEQGHTTVQDMTTLQAHVDADQAQAQLPVVLPVIYVRGDLPPIIGEWSVGDTATMVITDDFLLSGVATSMRIISAEISPPDANNDESVALTVATVLEDVV